MSESINKTGTTVPIKYSTVDLSSSSPSESFQMQRQSKSFTFPGVRYMILILCSTSCLFTCFTRANINIALVAMTKHSTNSSDFNSTFNSNATSTDMSTMKTYDWNQNVQGTILGSFFWTYTVFQIPAGMLVEKFGGKWIVSVALISSVVINMLTPEMANQLETFIASRMLLGLLGAGVFSGCFAILTNWIPKSQRSLSYSLLRVGAIIGTIAINIVSGYLCATLGWPSVFYWPAFITALFTVIFILLMQSHPCDHRFISSNELTLIQSSNGKRIEPSLSQIPWPMVLTNGPVLSAGFIKFSYFWLFFTIQSKLPTYLDTVMGMDLKSNGNINGLFNAFNGISLFITGWLSDRIIERGYMSRIITRKVFTVIAIMGSGLLLALIPTFSSANDILLVLYSSAFLLGFASGGDVPLPAEMSPSMPATIFSLINMVCMISGFTAPQFAGLILVHVDGSMVYRWSIIFYTTFAICSLATILFIFYASCERQDFDFYVLGENNNGKKETVKEINESKDRCTSTSSTRRQM